MSDKLASNYPGSYDNSPEDNKTEYGHPIDDPETPSTTYDKETANKWGRRLRLGVAAVAATATAAAGIFVYNLKGGNEERAPKAAPAATAGLAPGETAPTPSAPAETVGSSPEAPAVDMNTWDINTFEYDLEGKTYKGVAELEAAYGIKVGEAPTSPEEFEEQGIIAAEKLIGNINTWINSIDTKADNERYAPYNGTVKNGLVRSGGIAKELAGPAWGEVLSTDDLDSNEQGGTNPAEFVELMTNLHVQNVQDAAKQRNEGGKDNHKAEYVINDRPTFLLQHQGTVAVEVDMTFKGPNRKEDLIGNITMKQVEGTDGTLLWKVIAFNVTDKPE